MMEVSGVVMMEVSESPLSGMNRVVMMEVSESS